MAAALDAGADDMRDDGDSWEIVSPPDAFQKVLEAVKALGIEPAPPKSRCCRRTTSSSKASRRSRWSS